MAASVNEKLMWLGASTMRRHNTTPSMPGGNYETVDTPPEGYEIPEDEGNLDAKLYYVQTVPVTAGLTDLKRWYNTDNVLPAFDIYKNYELSKAHKVELWPYFLDIETAIAEAPNGIVVAAQIDLLDVPDSEFPLTVSGQLTKLGGKATDVTTGRRIYGPIDPSTMAVVDKLEIPLSAKAGPNYFYMGVKWLPEEILDDIVYRANVKIVGQTDKVDTYTGIKVVTCGKVVEWLALTPPIADQYELMSHGTTANPAQQRIIATMYTNIQIDNPGDSGYLIGAYSPISTEHPGTLGCLSAAFPPMPGGKVKSLHDYLDLCARSLLGADLYFSTPIDAGHCETHYIIQELSTPTFRPPLSHSEVQTYISPDGKQTIDKVCLTYRGSGTRGIMGGNLGTVFCVWDDSDTATVVQGHNPIDIPNGVYFNQIMYMTPLLGMIAERYSDIRDPDSADWPSSSGSPSFWMETQDGFVKVPYEHFDRLLPEAVPDAARGTYNLDTQKLLDYLGTTEGAPLGALPVNMNVEIRPQGVDWDRIQLADNVEIFWNHGTLSVSQVPTTWQNVKNGARLILNIVSTIGALASGAALGAAVIKYGATALGGSKVVLGAVQTGVKLYKATQGAGSAAEDLWQYPRNETIYTISDPESMKQLIRDHPEFAPKSPSGSGVIN